MSDQSEGEGDNSGSPTDSSDKEPSFPPDLIKRLVRKRKHANKIDEEAAACLAAVLEYLTTEVLELAGNAACDNRKTTIVPRHILLAIHSDEGLKRLLAGAIIAEGGVMPNVQCILPPQKSSEDSSE